MKNTSKLLAKLSFAVLALAFLLTGCKKEEKIAPTDQQILENKIQDIIPQQYLDTLKILGLTIHSSTTPPNVEGVYDISPTKLRSTNRPQDIVGSTGFNSKMKLFEQSPDDFSIRLLGKMFLSENDTSIATAISGSGNNFTVYGKVKSVFGENSAIIAIILSATKDGDALRNVEFGIINIDNSNGGNVFIEEGQGRVWFDSDFISNTTNVFRMSDRNMTENQPAQPGNTIISGVLK